VSSAEEPFHHGHRSACAGAGPYGELIHQSPGTWDARSGRRASQHPIDVSNSRAAVLNRYLQPKAARFGGFENSNLSDAPRVLNNIPRDFRNGCRDLGQRLGNQVEILGHRRELPSDGQQREKQTTIKHKHNARRTSSPYNTLMLYLRERRRKSFVGNGRCQNSRLSQKRAQASLGLPVRFWHGFDTVDVIGSCGVSGSSLK